jgi:serine/threonine-protein kinase
MAEVYLALSGELPGFRTLAVVKRILPHLASNGQFIRMFLDEARLAALLDHPNVVRIMEVGHDGEEYFLAMELVQGKPLSAVLRKAAREKRPPSASLAAYIVAQAASGLAYAHGLTDGDGRTLGVVHRDVSPQNVLISFEGAVKLIDFGVARAFGRVAHTSPGGLKGKIDYMSPEQASAEEVDHRADVFALGVVLWESLTGRRLFRRDTELATMRAIVDDPIPRPSELASVPPELDAIAMRALRKRRDARFQSAHEMVVALERYAFSHDGFSPAQVAVYMKDLFASENLQWRKTATAALDMEVEQPEASQHPSVAALNTEAATMALRPGVAWTEGRGSDARSHGALSPARLQENPSRASGGAAAAAPRKNRDRLWVYGGLAALAAVTIGGAWVLVRPSFTLSISRGHGPPAPESAPPPLESLPPSPAPVASQPRPRAEPETAAAKTTPPGPDVPPAATGAPLAPGAAPSTAEAPASAAPATAARGAKDKPKPPRPRPHHRLGSRAEAAADGKPSDTKSPDGAPAAANKADPFEE